MPAEGHDVAQQRRAARCPENSSEQKAMLRVLAILKIIVHKVTHTRTCDSSIMSDSGTPHKPVYSSKSSPNFALI
jgi:hypothetical protein